MPKRAWPEDRPGRSTGALRPVRGLFHVVHLNRSVPPAATANAALFVDANVFMYLAGSDPVLRTRCREALRAADEQEMALVTSAEVSQEILHRYSALDRPDDARVVYDSVTAICSDIVPITERETARALELLLRHSRLPARDALHAATMETNGIHRILSADRHFDRLEAVERVDPADLARPA